ncbi:AraC family transcriptional regulator [Pseudomonas sp. FME51]|uniref:AraC family transcriptional regulator n=1 Tax=Pseudomonas sp. FME51 TaxID=2742609 RepID=UPI0018696C74|nr:AraC family transcriptional regulator [Pseudomonas sp. FME51]
MDLLGEVLLSLRIESNVGGIYCLADQWGLLVPALSADYAYAICCIDTPVWLLRPDCPPLVLNPGDSALLLQGNAFSLASDPTVECVNVFEYWEQRQLPIFKPGSRPTAPIAGLSLGEGAIRGQMLVLAFAIHEGSSNPLLRSLPSLIHLEGSAQGMFPWMKPLVDFLASEQHSTKPGYLATASHLANLILTSFIRAWVVTSTPHGSGWLRGMTDQRIRRALASVHNQPGEAWNTETLAKQAGMSRFAFARRFCHLVGQSPSDYLRNWRMHLAAERLLTGQESVARIAEGVGYQSERAFREAFKQRFGQAPLQYAKSFSPSISTDI